VILLKVLIIDYGVGNLFSLENAFKKFKTDVKILSKPENIQEFDIIVLPGVGNFSQASKNIKYFKKYIKEAIRNGLIILGICLGMQILFSKSEEGKGEGLKILDGKVVKLPNKVKIPHIGWNSIRIIKNHELINGIPDGAFYYFAHSYYSIPKNKEIIITETYYGKFFPSIIAWKNVYGTQFHPEKSGKYGIKLLENLLKNIKK